MVYTVTNTRGRNIHFKLYSRITEDAIGSVKSPNIAEESQFIEAPSGPNSKSGKRNMIHEQYAIIVKFKSLLELKVEYDLDGTVERRKK